MKGDFQHSWNLSPARAVELQKRIKSLVIERTLEKPVSLIAGVDAAIAPEKNKIIAAVVLLRTNPFCLSEPSKFSLHDITVIEQQHAWADLTFPYIPGLLSFREAPVVLKALAKLQHRPDLLILDAQGKAHPRGAGLASHVGVLSHLPCVGCAKSRLIGRHLPVAQKKGSFADLLDKDDHVIGRVLRTRRAVKCVYVSVGHLVDLNQASRTVLDLAVRYRLPEPTRLAHLLAAKLKTSSPPPE